jgi:hypothetical protein
MVNRLVSVGDDFKLPAAVKVENANLPAALQPTALSATYGTFISPLSKGAVGDGVANDYAALVATLSSAATFGSVIDLGGRTFKLGQTLGIGKAVVMRNGTLTCAVDRVATVTAASTRLENVQFVRTGSATANSGALTLNAATCVLIDVVASSTTGEALRMGNGTCNGTEIRGGRFSTSDTTEAIAVHLMSGAAHNYDVSISEATVRHTGYGTAVAFFNCSRSTIFRNNIQGIRRSPWATITGWSLVSGAVYRALDRTDVTSNAVYVNDMEYGKNADPASTTPALNSYTTPGDGYLYINTGIDPTTQTVKTTRTNGYGALLYATSTEALGMKDNFIAFNNIEDTDGPGIYIQTLENVPKSNHTLQNILRNVCKLGITVNNLPIAGLSVFGGQDVQLNGDIIDGSGSALTPAPGIDFKASVGVPHMSGKLANVVVRNATKNGISLAPGTWTLSAVTTSDNTLAGITHGTFTSSDTLDATLTGCVAQNNTTNGTGWDTSSSGNLRVRISGGKYANNTQRNISFNGVRDSFIGGGVISDSAGTAGINISGTCQRITLDGIHLLGGVGITIGSGVTDLTKGLITHNGSSGTKFNFTGWHRVGGMTGYAGQAFTGAGTPEGVQAAPIGSMGLRSDGGAGTTLYVKETGTGNTGWVAK